MFLKCDCKVYKALKIKPDLWYLDAMKKIISFILLFSMSLPVFASTGDSFSASMLSKRVEDNFTDDRDTRLSEINKIVLKINQSETELSNFRFELSRVQSNSSKLDHAVFMRNTAGIIAALGFVTTLVYQKKHISPNVFKLVGGYTLSAISMIVMTVENKGVRLSQKEISDLEQSIANLEKLISIEKINLQKEIDVLETPDP
jgi:hypothetical protein